MKVNHFAALDTQKMLMILQTAVEPSRLTGSLHHESGPDFRQSMQRAINCIQRNIADFVPNFCANFFSRRMRFHADQGLINRNPLRRNLQSVPAAALLEIF